MVFLYGLAEIYLWGVSVSEPRHQLSGWFLPRTALMALVEKWIANTAGQGSRQGRVDR